MMNSLSEHSTATTMETGPAGQQIQVLDPDGNPVELFEPAHRG